jgi:2-keto-3-deoxy-L-rhamnonate aldolase RhmA
MASQARDIARNHAKEKLARGEVVASMTVRLVRGPEIAQVAQSAGFDTFYVDIEHCSFSLETVSALCLAGLAAGITPMVRVPNGRPEWVTRVLEGGALGVIVPHVRSAEEARRVVAAAKFAPAGERSYAGGAPQLQFRSFPALEAMAAINEATMVVVMMETLEALERVDEIAAVDGVDMLFIGTNDLTTEMGIVGKLDDPRVRDAYTRTIAACRKHGKHTGIGGLASRPDLIAEYAKLGARFVSTGTDLGFLAAACAQKAQQVRDIRL